MTARHAVHNTPIGPITIAVADDVITGLFFPEHWHPPTDAQLGELVDIADDHLLATAALQLDEFLAGARIDFNDLPIATAAGDGFQQRVWTLLRTIPYGTTTTYGALAAQLGGTHLARAVGGAVGRNPISIIVPCHRVMGAGGKITGYAGGLERKQFLLNLETPGDAPVSTLF